MKEKKKEIKIYLSFEPAYQVIYWSLIWLTLFIGLIIWLEYTRFNWISLVMGGVALLMILPSFKTYLSVKDERLLFFYGGRAVKKVPFTSIQKIGYSTGRKINVYGKNNSMIYYFYLNQKNKKKLLQYINHSYPKIEQLDLEDVRKLDNSN